MPEVVWAGLRPDCLLLLLFFFGILRRALVTGPSGLIIQPLLNLHLCSRHHPTPSPPGARGAARGRRRRRRRMRPTSLPSRMNIFAFSPTKPGARGGKINAESLREEDVGMSGWREGGKDE